MSPQARSTAHSRSERLSLDAIFFFSGIDDNKVLL
jgi:hypothetical protein